MFPFHRKFKFPSVNGLNFPIHTHILVKSILSILNLSLLTGEEQECHRIITKVVILMLNFLKISSSSFSTIWNRKSALLLLVSWEHLCWPSKQTVWNASLRSRSEVINLCNCGGPHCFLQSSRREWQRPELGTESLISPGRENLPASVSNSRVGHIFLLFDIVKTWNLKNMVGKEEMSTASTECDLL